MKVATFAVPVIPTPNGLKSKADNNVCVANINTKGRRGRLVFGIFQFAFAIAVLAGLMAIGLDRLWRLPLLFIFWAAAVGFFQWRDKTCVALARLGSREL